MQAHRSKITIEDGAMAPGPAEQGLPLEGLEPAVVIKTCFEPVLAPIMEVSLVLATPYCRHCCCPVCAMECVLEAVSPH